MLSPRRHRPLVRRALRVVSSAGLASLLMVPAVGVWAQTSTDWSQFQGSAARAGFARSAPQPAYDRAWFTADPPAGPGGRFGLSAPVAAGGIAITVGPEQVAGTDVASGEQRFAVDRDLGPSVPAAIAPDGSTVVYTQGWGDGPPAVSPTAEASPSPAAAEDAESRSSVAAFDLETQDARWSPIPLDAVSRTGVAIDGDSAYVGTNAGTVTAVDIAGGEVAWSLELGATIVTPVAVADETVLIGLQGDRTRQPAIVAVDAGSGEERWRYEPEALSAAVSAVSVEGGSAFAVVSGPNEIAAVALDLADGVERWRYSLNAALDLNAPPVVGAGVVFLTDLSGHVRALDAETGEERWDFAVNAPTFRSLPMLAGDHLLVPTIEGALAAIDVGTGTLAWRRAPDGAPLRALAPAGDVIVAVRGGARSGLEGLEHDPAVALVSEASPTTLALGRMLGAMAIAVIALLAIVLLLGRALIRRMGPAFPDDDGHEAEEPDEGEPIHDPWEDEGATP